MNSWRLFVYGIVFWESFENPIFLREMEHKLFWHNSIKRVPRVPILTQAIAVGSFFVWTISVLYFKNLLLLILLPRFLLVSTISFVLAPIVVEERVKRSLEVLLATPISPQDLLLGKVGGALWWLRHVFLAMSVLLFVAAMGVGFISLALIPTSLPLIDEVPIFVLCFGVIILPIVWSVIFVIDRIQQILLVISATVVASTSASSLRMAFFSAISVSLIVWFLEVFVAGLLLALQPGRTTFVAETDLITLITLGPVANFIIEFNLGETFFWTCCILGGREMAIRSLWHWAEGQIRSF